MTIDNPEITINLDTKRLIAIAILAIISVYTLYSYSIALLAFIAPDDSTPFIRVTNFNTYTTGDVVQSSFTRGSIVRIKASVEKATAYYTTPPAYTSISDPTPCKISVVFYYISGGAVHPIKFRTLSVTLQPGVPKNIQFDTPIPSTGPTGANYYVKIFVWDDYLPSGGNNIIDVGNSDATTRTVTGT